MATISVEDILRVLQERGVKAPQAAQTAVQTSTAIAPRTGTAALGTNRYLVDPAALSAALVPRGGQQAAQGGGWGGALGKVLGAIDLPRAILTSGVKEIKDLFDGEGFNLGDFTQQARTHYGFGDFLRDEDIDLGKWGNRAVGLAGDILLDPLSWTGGLGAFARARGARGLVDDLAPLVKDLGELGVRDATQQATLRAAQDAVVAAGGKGGSVSRARNVLARQHGDAGKKLIDDLGIETGLRFRIPGTGPVLGRLSRGSERIARKRAAQIPRLVRERMEKALGANADIPDLVFKAQRRQTLDHIPDAQRQILQRAANVPVDVLPFGVFPIASGVAASVMSSPGIGWEKMASGRIGQTFRNVLVDPQKKYIDDLARGRGATDDIIAAREKKRVRAAAVRELRRTGDPDKIIFANFLRNSYNRGSATSGYWASEAMRRRKIFLNEVQQNVGSVDDGVLGRLTDLSPELVDDFADGIVSPQVMDSVRGRFPGLSDEEIMFVIKRYDELIRVPDVEFLSRADLYGSEGRLVDDMNDVMVDFGGYTPEIWTPEGLAVLRSAHGGDLPPWMEGIARQFDEVMPEARTMDEVRQRATSGGLRRREMRPSGTRRDGTFEAGTELRIPKQDGSGVVRRILQRSNPQRTQPLGGGTGSQQRVVGAGPDGRSSVIRRDLTPEELATRGRRPARELTGEPEGLSILEQVDAAYREAGWLDEDGSLFVRGFQARENAHINSLAADIRLRAIESYASSQGLIYNADTYRGHAAALAELEDAIRVGKVELQGLSDSEVAAQAVVEGIEAGGSARAQTIENLEAWVARHGEDASGLEDRLAQLNDELTMGRVEASDLTREVSEIVEDLQTLLGYRGVAAVRRGAGVEDIPFEELVAAPPTANPVAFSIDAIRELAPILEDLDTVMVRARLLTEGVERFRTLSDEITNLDPDPQGFLSGLQGLQYDIEDSLKFLEDDLLPFAESLSNDAMLLDDTRVAITVLQNSSALSAGTQNISVDDLFDNVNRRLIEDVGLGDAPYSPGMPAFPFPRESVLRVGLDATHAADGSVLFPPATSGGAPRSMRNMLDSAFPAGSPEAARGRLIGDSIEQLRGVHERIAKKIAVELGLDTGDAAIMQEVKEALSFRELIGPNVTFDMDQVSVSFTVFGVHQRIPEADFLIHLGGQQQSVRIGVSEFQAELGAAFGKYMDAVVLYEADRLGVHLVAGGGITTQASSLQSLRAGGILGAAATQMQPGGNGLYNHFRAWVLPDEAGNMQVIWSKPRPTQAVIKTTQYLKALWRADPTLARTTPLPLDDVLPDGRTLRDVMMGAPAIQNLVNSGSYVHIADWVERPGQWGVGRPVQSGRSIERELYDIGADFNRKFFDGEAGLRSSSNGIPLDTGGMFGMEVNATFMARLEQGEQGLLHGSGRGQGQVPPEQIRGNALIAQGGVRTPTEPGAIRGAQGGVFKRSLQDPSRAQARALVPGTVSLGAGPPRAAHAAGIAVAERADILDIMGVLENTLNVNYLSNLPGMDVDEAFRLAQVTRLGLLNTAEQAWGSAGVQRYMPFLGQGLEQPISGTGREAIDVPAMRARVNSLQEALEDELTDAHTLGWGARADDALVELTPQTNYTTNVVSPVRVEARALRAYAEGDSSLLSAALSTPGEPMSPSMVDAVMRQRLTEEVNQSLQDMVYWVDANSGQYGAPISAELSGPQIYQTYAIAVNTNSDYPLGRMIDEIVNAGADPDVVMRQMVDAYLNSTTVLTTPQVYTAGLLHPNHPTGAAFALGGTGGLYPNEYPLMLTGDVVYNPAAAAAGGSMFTPGIPPQIASVIYNAHETGVGLRSNEYWDAIQSVLDNWGVPNNAFERSELVEWGYLVQHYDQLRGANFEQASFMAEQRLYGAFDNAITRSSERIDQLRDQIAAMPPFDPAARAAAEGRLAARQRTLLKKEELVEKIRLQRVTMEAKISALEQQRNDLSNKIGTMLGPTNGKPFNLNSFNGQVDLSKVTAVQLQDLFNAGGKQMWGSGALDEWLIAGNAEFADEFTYAMLAAQKMDDRVEVSGFLKAYDKAHNYLKAQMVATPGFVSRNLMGGMVNMWFADIPLSETFKTGRLLNRAYRAGDGDLAEGLRKLVAANPSNAEYANALEMVNMGVHGGGQAASMVTVDLGKTNRMDFVFGSKTNTKYSGRIKMNPLDAGFFLFAGVRHANSFAEEMMRLGTGLYVRRTGGSIDDALEMVYKLHFNYGGLSAAERKVGKRLFPFYTWTRNNLPLQVSFLANSPGKFNRLMSLRRNIELGEEREGMVPDYFMEGFGLKLPFSIGGAQAYSQPDFPLQDLFRFDPTQRGYGKSMEQVFSSTTPFLKTPIEYWAGKRVFEGIPFREEYVPVPVAWRSIPGLMQAAQTLGWAKKNSRGEWMMYDNRLAVLDNAMPYIGRLRRVIPEDEKTQSRWIQSVMSMFGGVSLRLNTPREQRNERVRRRVEREMTRDDRRSLEIPQR